MGEKSVDGLAIQLTWVPFVVEEDEAFDPVDVGVFRAQAVMPAAKDRPDGFQQFGLVRRGLSGYFLLHKPARKRATKHTMSASRIRRKNVRL